MTQHNHKTVHEAEGLSVGLKSPAFKAKDQNEQTFNLDEA